MLWACAALAFSPSSADAEAAILRQFKSHRLVALGESHHCQEEHAFLRHLVARRDFPEYVRNIVVEFGNGLYQHLADRYVAGRTLPEQELSRIWRNTTVPLAWDTPEYPAFFKAIRDANRGRDSAHRIRVILGDPAIDWAKVHNSNQFAPFADRDRYFFREVDSILTRGERALLIYGSFHVLKRDIRGSAALKNSPEALPELGSRYGSQIFSIWPVVGPSHVTTPSHYPVLLQVSHTDLAALSSQILLSKSVKFKRTANGKSEFYSPDPADMPKLGDAIDAFLFVSKTNHESVVKVSARREPAYTRELLRRGAILDKVYGFPISDQIRASIAH